MSTVNFSKTVRKTIQYILPLVALVMAIVLPGTVQAEPGRPVGVALLNEGATNDSGGAPARVRMPGSTSEVAADPPAAETWQWMFGQWTQQKGLNCSIIGQHYIETMTMASVGYEGTTPESVPFHPYVGETYYGSIYMGVTGNPCGLGFDNIATRAILPPNTVLAIDENHPVRCWGLLASGGNWQELTNATWRNPASGTTGPYCKTTPTQWADGSWDFGFRPIARGQQFQVLFPMRSLSELKGMAGPNGGDRMGAVVTSAVSTNYADFPSPAVPTQWVNVIPNPTPPSVSYPTPSSTNVTETTARTTARLDNHFVGGNVFFDLGTSTEYGISTPAAAIGANADFYPEIFADWAELLPGTTYHWRMRFVAADGRVFPGVDQTFTTAAPTAITISDARLIEGNTGTTDASFRLSLSRASDREVQVTYATADGTAKAGQDYTATTNTAIFPAGTTTKTITVPITGDTLNELNETLNVNLTAPVGATIADAQAVATITNDDAAPTLTISDVTVKESTGSTANAVFTVRLSAASGRPVSVRFATANGTAVSVYDYTRSVGTVSFEPGMTTKQVVVPIRGDALYESNETFMVNLASPVGATIVDAQAVGTITNDDVAPKLGITNVTIKEATGSAVNAVFTVRLSAASGLPVNVRYATANGTALAGQDYTAGTGQLSFPAGTTTKQIIVPVTGDALYEASETFMVNLTEPVGATIADAQAVCVITNDDVAPTVTISDVTIQEGTGSTVNAVFTVKLSAASGSVVRVTYTTANGTALAGQDYTSRTGLLGFAVGTTTKQIIVPVTGDSLREANETFKINLTSPVGATIVDAQAVGTIANND